MAKVNSRYDSGLPTPNQPDPCAYPTEYDIRLSALNQACHDFRGEAPSSEVVERARCYYDFLSGDRVGRGNTQFGQQTCA